MIEQELINRAIAGEETAVREFIALVMPVIRRQVINLVPRRAHVPRNPLIEDLTQTILLRIFADDAQFLRKWKSELGRSIETYLAVFARYNTNEMLRSRKMKERPHSDIELYHISGATEDLENVIINQEQAETILGKLALHLNESDLGLFRRLFIDDQPSEQICRELGINRNALDKRRQRIRERILQILGDQFA